LGLQRSSCAEGTIGRRTFLLAVGTLALSASRLAGAQSGTRVYRVASLTTGSRSSPQFAALERRFRELGYIEGKNFVLDARALGGDWSKIPEIVAELARARPDVAMAFGSEAVLRAFRQAMGATPIVMIAVNFDPVEKNYIASLARPGGNITGVFFRQEEAGAKRMELLRETLPKATRVAALFDASSRHEYQAAGQIATKLGIALLPYELRGNPYDFETALGAAATAKAQAVLALTSGAFFPAREKWIGAARKLRLPVVANPNYAEAGALVSFGASFPHMYARAAEYADRILKGAKPAEMPVEQPTQFELIVNLKTAKALGITIPPHVLVRATRIIE
jgi:putative tryptophan/tyrosine transport system substrate-binding protein